VEGSGAGVGDAAKANLNENLKNIGRFFKRDVGGGLRMGGFGRSEEGGR
jgi:hypothetical protein